MGGGGGVREGRGGEGVSLLQDRDLLAAGVAAEHNPEASGVGGGRSLLRTVTGRMAAGRVCVAGGGGGA